MKPFLTCIFVLLVAIIYAQEYDSIQYLKENHVQELDTNRNFLKIFYEPNIDYCEYDDGVLLYCELGTPCGYKNQNGDTIIPINKNLRCYTQESNYYVIVSPSDYSSTTGLSAFDITGKKLFDIHVFDNGPDYIKDGLFRIHKRGKVGFANNKGEIVVSPEYQCADFFRDGTAAVTKNCKLISEGEYYFMDSDNWYHIDTLGNTISYIDRDINLIAHKYVYYSFVDATELVLQTNGQFIFYKKVNSTTNYTFTGKWKIKRGILRLSYDSIEKDSEVKIPQSKWEIKENHILSDSTSTGYREILRQVR